MHITYEFNSGVPGPNLLMFGAIHGNEKCGTHALRRLKDQLESGKFKLLRGILRIVPVCNPEAFEQNKRFVESNLNRVFRHNAKPKALEERYANQLIHHVKWADYLLDLHSFHSDGQPFVFQDYAGRAQAEFAAHLGLDQVFVGWPEVYKKYPKLSAWSTDRYAMRVKTIGVTVECGQHDAPESIETAWMCVLNALKFLKMTAGKPAAKAREKIRMRHVFFKEEDGKFIRPLSHLQPVRKGEGLAVYHSGRQMSAPENGLIIMPNEKAPIGQEWLYIGVKV